MTLPEENCETRPEGKTGGEADSPEHRKKGAERPRSGAVKHEEATPPPTRKRSSSDHGSDGSSPRTSCEADADDGLAKLEALFLCAVAESRRTGTAQVLQCKDANEADQVFEFDGDGGGRVKRLRVGSQVSILQVPGKRHGTAVISCASECRNWIRSNKMQRTVVCTGDAKVGSKQDGHDFDPDVAILPHSDAEGEGQERPRFVLEVETRHRGPCKMREQYWHYFQGDHGVYLQGVVGIKIWETGDRETWQAAAVFWCRETPDQPPTVRRAIDFGVVELSDERKDAFCSGSDEELLPAVEVEQWERCPFPVPGAASSTSAAASAHPQAAEDASRTGDPSTQPGVEDGEQTAAALVDAPSCVLQIAAPVILHCTGLDPATVPCLSIDLHVILEEIWPVVEISEITSS
eukprot:CAMPEP_0118998340 /NCGR_PEP_ID=MMETSP1173-20130426/63026_1 /TAXON_ID=1034831 /ORGANISM="Rhizochromulina marina cf, Strain CCMP1243" /LENGTH=405 /DNA_ID=CAMNT_0006949831 /DNA_START=88 /DNA_END=1305 /DNA_ORIENTATION=+